MPVCPACGKELPGEFPFCPFCGADLGAPAVPGGTRERKVVSVLFCDLVGFTASSESADPEEVQARLGPYHSHTRERIEAFGGTVEKFIGDAVMAVFGAPTTHEDDAERAVRAGLSILEGIEELNETGELGLSVRIGINTGEAVVTLGARPEQGEGIATGDVVNTAARIQSAAPVGGVAVGLGTYQATDRVFEYEPLDPATAKGKTEPVPMWRALAPVARFGSDVIRSLTTPLVGRETDLALMRSLFDKVARDSEVQLVTIVGEPGVGKSRLVAELFAYIDERPELVTWRQGRCLPYGDGITFWALGEIMKAHAGIYESDSPDDAAAKLDALLPESDDKTWLRARLLPLVGVETGQPLSREESFTAWRRFLEAIAEDGPTVLVVEDIHWADEALLAFLEHLADWAQGVPLIVVCTARPELYESHGTWGAGLSNHTAIRLGPLSDIETARLVGALLEQAVLPAETQQLLLERAGGNPLYAEEFVRMLRDRDLLDEHGELRAGAEVPFPDSIHALIAARIDTLPPDRKLLLHDAAVVGKVFWARSVAEMGMRESPEVEALLHELTRKELIRPSRQSSMEGEAEYGFWHLLVRDVVYGQIPRAERAEKHLTAAAWIEGKAGERVEDLADVLMYHYETAGDLLRSTGRELDAVQLLPATGRFAKLAAERAAVLDARLAADLYARALRSLPSDDPARGELLLEASETLRHVGRHDEATEALAEAQPLFERRGDKEGLARAIIAESVLRRNEGTDVVREIAFRAVELVEGTDSPVVASAYARLATAHYVSGRDRDAVEWAERSLAASRNAGAQEEIAALGVRGGSRAALGDRGGLDDMRQAIALARARELTREAALWLNNLATAVYVYEGPASSLAVAREAEALAASRGILETAHEARATCIEFLYDTGDWDGLLAEADALRQESSATTLHEMGAVVADVLVCRGRVDEARDTLARQVEASRETGEVQHLIMALSVAAALAAATGEERGARALIAELCDVPELRGSYNFPAYLPELVRTVISVGDTAIGESLLDGFEVVAPMHRYARLTAEAQIAEAHSDLETAARLFEDAAQAWKEFGFVPEEAFALLGRGRCLVSLRDPAADRPLREARALFAGMGARPRIDECDTLIARVAKLTS
ncbi:MAG TPA: adenylate/guanylate cyclase domain-containing protein [Gaiellaceae bacterium]|nr:adenylate/guanylate cyclase domain-containing protein [Gaiellaceae bacterium]